MCIRRLSIIDYKELITWPLIRNKIRWRKEHEKVSGSLTQRSDASDSGRRLRRQWRQSTPSDSQKEEQTPSTDHAGSDLVVGFSTGAAGTTFRQEGIDDFTKAAEEYKAEGRIKDYKIVNTTNWDANEQANIIRDFINDDEINVIVVNPNSPTDLNGVLAEAVAAGKTVVAAVSAPQCWR